MTVLHISTDYPDALVPSKTRAVERLVAAAKGQHNVVYSLNRVNGLSRIEALPSGPDCMAVAYEAPPKGVWLEHRLAAVTQWMAADLHRRGIRPTVIHAHKLTMEGLIGLELAKLYDCRLVVSIQGDTDTKILRARRDLRHRYREVVERADKVISVSRWPVAPMRAALGQALDRCIVLPALTGIDTMLPSQATGECRLVSVFHLSSWHRKGADTVATAVALASREFPTLTVDIFGAGSPPTMLAMHQVLERAGVKDRVNLLGFVPNDDIQTRLNAYSGFVLPSRRETYGMAYAEAVFSGLPILYSAGRGIDGMVPDAVGYASDPSSAADVAEGMRRLLRNESEMKAAVAVAQQDGSLEGLRADTISAAYGKILADLA